MAKFEKILWDNNFIHKFDNPEISRQWIYPASLKNIKNREGFEIGPQI